MFEQYAKFYDLLNQDKSYRKEIEFVYKWAEKPRSILDIGCGTASYWRHFPQSVKVIGMEKSADMIPSGKGIIYADVTKFQPPEEMSFDCATALFDVVNYIPEHGWWKNIPVKPGGYFIFDIWDARKVKQDGFTERVRRVGDVIRVTTPVKYDGKVVDLDVEVRVGKDQFTERHRMYVYTDAEIAEFCGKEWIIEDTRDTKTWQKWWKLRRCA